METLTEKDSQGQGQIDINTVVFLLMIHAK